MEENQELTTEVRNEVTSFIDEANAHVITHSIGIEIARDRIRAGRVLKEKIIEKFKPIKEKARAAHLAVCALENEFLNPVAEATGIYTQKITDLQVAEEKRIEEQRRIAEEAAQKKREAAEKKAQAKIDAMADKCLSINEQITELQTALNSPEITDDEADILHAKISSLIASMDSTKGDIVKQQAKIEAAASAAPVSSSVPAPPKVKGVGGLKMEKIPEIKNPYILLQGVVSKTVPLAIVEFNMAKIKRLVNDGMELPGVVCTEKPKTTIR